jgi:hypothetical protein
MRGPKIEEILVTKEKVKVVQEPEEKNAAS